MSLHNVDIIFKQRKGGVSCDLQTCHTSRSGLCYERGEMLRVLCLPFIMDKSAVALKIWTNQRLNLKSVFLDTCMLVRALTTTNE